MGDREQFDDSTAVAPSELDAENPPSSNSRDGVPSFDAPTRADGVAVRRSSLRPAPMGFRPSARDPSTLRPAMVIHAGDAEPSAPKWDAVDPAPSHPSMPALEAALLSSAERSEPFSLAEDLRSDPSTVLIPPAAGLPREALESSEERPLDSDVGAPVASDAAHDESSVESALVAAALVAPSESDVAGAPVAATPVVATPVALPMPEAVASATPDGPSNGSDAARTESIAASPERSAQSAAIEAAAVADSSRLSAVAVSDGSAEEATPSGAREPLSHDLTLDDVHAQSTAQSDAGPRSTKQQPRLRAAAALGTLVLLVGVVAMTVFGRASSDANTAPALSADPQVAVRLDNAAPTNTEPQQAEPESVAPAAPASAEVLQASVETPLGIGAASADIKPSTGKNDKVAAMAAKPSAKPTSAPRDTSAGNTTRVTLDLKPIDAKVYLRGVNVPGPPYVFDVHKGERIVVEVIRFGFVTRKVTITDKKPVVSLGMVRNRAIELTH